MKEQLEQGLENTTFLDFSDLLTGYRLSLILMTVQESGLFAALPEQGAPLDALCRHTGWEPAYGRRFLQCLCNLGMLYEEGEVYFPSRFSLQYLCPHGQNNQAKTLTFEHRLLDNWQQLQAILQAGGRLSGTTDKSAQELRQARILYLGAMDEAATIRAEELWDTLAPVAPRGVLLDIGGGSGAFLRSFLDRHPQWSAVFCDLPDIIASQELHQALAPVAERIRWCGCNLLADQAGEFAAIGKKSCDLVLLSNIIHCQSLEETTRLLQRAADRAADDGLVLIHDFFTDSGWRGALYDLHMMVNTYNGRTYTSQEVIGLMEAHGFTHYQLRQLESGSELLVFARSAQSLATTVRLRPEVTAPGW